MKYSKQKRDSIALYLHIPFCVKKCKYCDFNSFVSDSKVIDRYLCSLEKELVAFAGQYTFHTVYVGGGTPSMLSDAQIEKLLCIIQNGIGDSDIDEFTVEVNPGTLTDAKVDLLKVFGVNRVSIGIQSFHDEYLKFLGRIHTARDAREAYELFRKSGFQNINIDLIFGCPGQSLSMWENDLLIATKLYPEHISTYSLTYEAGTPLAKELQDECFCEVDEKIEREMYETTIDFLRRNGYTHYEISNFSLPGFACIHNHVYWENKSYLGVGAGAYSFLDGVRFSKEKNILKYIHGIQSNNNIISFREKLQQNQSAAETVIMALRLRNGISNIDFSSRYGYNIEEQFADQIDKLSRYNLVRFENQRLTLTEKGLFVADSVLSEFV